MTDQQNWADDADELLDDELDIQEYEISAAPNDFNIMTITSFIDRGSIIIPNFQRNYVWDQRRASKLIESLILGLPVPQVFLYEEANNRFLVIDGQQRLMSIYFFMKGRFPRMDSRSKLREELEGQSRIPNEILFGDMFGDFKLDLPSPTEKVNKFKGMNVHSLGQYKDQLELRALRNIIIKQISPQGDDSSKFEIFNRLNSGGVNLSPQEIRASLFHSEFYDLLRKLNMRDRWRQLNGLTNPDLHMKDVELILRGFAMLFNGERYKPSMVRFLNTFSKQAQRYTSEELKACENVFDWFLILTQELPIDIFKNPGNNRFNVALFEGVFVASTERMPSQGEVQDYDSLSKQQMLSEDTIRALAADQEFVAASQKASADFVNVKERLRIARKYIHS